MGRIQGFTSELRGEVRLARRETALNPPANYFNWQFQDGASFGDHICYFCLVFVILSCIDALWSPAGKELTSCLSFVVYNCEAVTFPLVSWVKCGA